jgi:hypothetical protein
MMKAPRFEGDQQVTISELNPNDAAKGNSDVPLLAFWGIARVETGVASLRGSLGGEPGVSD